MWYIHSLRFDRDVRVILHRNFVSMVTDINTPYLESWRYYQSLFSRWDQCVVLDPHRSPLWIQCEDRCDLVLVAQEHSEYIKTVALVEISKWIELLHIHPRNYNYHYFTKATPFQKRPPVLFHGFKRFQNGGPFSKTGGLFCYAGVLKE